MEILVSLFSIFFVIPLIDSTFNTKCPHSFCGNNYFPIQYPFKLESQNPQICGNYINLNCVYENNTVLNLLFSGDFSVEDISYSTKTILLYDPQDCLAKRLMKNINLDSSPFSAINYQKYTFYSCPVSDKLLSDGFTPIDCVSQYPNTTVCSSKMSPGEMMQLYGCTEDVTVEIPIAWDGQFDGIGIYSNLELTWDVPICKDCEEYQEKDKPRSKLSNFFRSPAFSPFTIVFGTWFFLLLFACVKKMIAARNRHVNAGATMEEVAMTPQTTTTTAVLPPRTTVGGGGASITGPDDPNYLKIVKSYDLEENCGNLNSSCTICLEEYKPGERMRSIILCQHYFHAHCIDQWFLKNSSCPVCRTSIFDVKT